MTKADLIEAVARATELARKDSEVVVGEIFENIIQTLNRGERIQLRGFGSSRVRQREARRWRNPKTGAPVELLAKRVVYFKPGKRLKGLISDRPAGESRHEHAVDAPLQNNSRGNPLFSPYSEFWQETGALVTASSYAGFE